MRGFAKVYPLRNIIAAPFAIRSIYEMPKRSVSAGITDLGVMMVRRLDILVLSLVAGHQATGIYYMAQQIVTVPHKIHQLFELQKKLGITRIALIGDKQQLSAIEAGRPFELLQENGMECTLVKNIRRQKNAELKGAVLSVIKQDIAAAFEKLKPDMVENSEQDLCYLAASEWLSLPDTEQKASLIITQTRAERSLINDLIRGQKLSSGEITGTTHNVNNLLARNLTPSQLKDSEAYQVGDVVLFNREYKRLGIERGGYAEVTGVDAKANTIELHINGQKAIWRPDQVATNAKNVVEVFEPQSIELASGDAVRFTKNFLKRGILNGLHAKVVTVTDRCITFVKSSGETLSLCHDDAPLKHIDYAWSSTTYSSQGKTVDQVFVVANSQHVNMNTAQSLYVQISRSRQKAHVFTDDAEELEMQVMKSLEPKPVHAVQLLPQSKFMQSLEEDSQQFVKRLLTRRQGIKSRQEKKLEPKRQPYKGPELSL